MEMLHGQSIFRRYHKNPILTPKDFPGADAVFNCGQTWYESNPLLLVSVLHKSGYYQGVRGATSHVARTEDGINFTIDPTPFLQKDDTPLYGSINNHPIDTRITKLDDTYYIIHPASSEWGTFGILSKTKDFKTHEYVEIISLPDNRVPCLFPEKIDGVYWRLDRPYRVGHNNQHDMGNIWICQSPDLIHWGKYRPLLRTGFAFWSHEKIGPVPPVKTSEGWLVLIHGVSSSCSGRTYRLGAMLLDMDDPTKVIGRTMTPLLSPDTVYEQCGRVPNVVFACGVLCDISNSQLTLYYGCADTSIGLAMADLDTVISLCKQEKDMGW